MVRNLGTSSALRVVPRLGGTDSTLRRFLPYLAVSGFVLLAWAAYGRAYPAPIFPVDDAYIVLHNAGALLSGCDRNYSGSSPLTGATSLIHLALVSLLMRGLGPLAALSTAAWLSALFYAAGLVRLARVNGLSRLQALLVAAAGLAAGETPHQLLNGLETGLMLATLTWALVLLSDPRGRPSLALPGLCGMLPFIRPDLTPLAFLFLSLQIARRWRDRRDIAAFRRGAGADMVIALACALPWALWYQAEVGSALPTTVAAKRYFFAEAGGEPTFKFAVVMRGFSFFGVEVGLLTCFAGFLGGTWLGRIGLAFTALLADAYFLQFPGALMQYEGRYLYPLLPFILLGAVHAMRPTQPHRRAATAALALALWQSVLVAPTFWAQHRSGCDNTARNLDGVADWCVHHLSAHSTLMVHDAGYISWGTGFRIVDLVGLKTPSSISYHQHLTYPSNGARRGEAVSLIALRQHPDYLIVLDGWEGIYHIAAGLRAQGWGVHLVNADYSYKVYALSPPPSPPQGPRYISERVPLRRSRRG